MSDDGYDETQAEEDRIYTEILFLTGDHDLAFASAKSPAQYRKTKNDFEFQRQATSIEGSNVSEDTINDSDFTDEGGYDPLFGGEKLVSLFDKTHGVGTERGGVITKVPETRQSRFFSEGSPGKLKYWGEDGKPTDQSRAVDGTPLRPCNDEVFVLQTDYQLSEYELKERDLDEDSGLRGVFASGNQLAAIRKAIKDAKVKNRNALVGMTLTLKRVGKKQVGDFKAWVWEAKLTGKPAEAPNVFDE